MLRVELVGGPLSSTLGQGLCLAGGNSTVEGLDINGFPAPNGGGGIVVASGETSSRATTWAPTSAAPNLANASGMQIFPG